MDHNIFFAKAVSLIILEKTDEFYDFYMRVVARFPFPENECPVLSLILQEHRKYICFFIPSSYLFAAQSSEGSGIIFLIWIKK